MGHLLSGGTARPASASDLDAYERMREQQAKQTVPVLQHRDRPHEYLFIALFDGTGQSAYDDRLLTNIGELKEQAEVLKLRPDRRIGVGYAEGIGTQKNPLTRAIDGAFPYTWDDKIRKVYRNLADQTQRWMDQDPQAQIRVVGAGYSRGAVLVPGFARLVDKFGIVDPEGMEFGRDTHGNLTVKSPRTLVPPGEVAQAVGLFDPVGTNLPKNYDARLPKSVLSGFSQLARDEQRELFAHQTILDPDWSDDGRFLSATVPGGHSNVGGGNDEAGLETLAFNGMADYLNALTDRPLFTHRRVPDDPAQFTIFQATGATAAFGLRMDKDGQRDLRDELANCTIVDICRDAEPVDLALANRFDWQRVTPHVPEPPPRLPEAIEVTRSVAAQAMPAPMPAPAPTPPSVLPVIRLDDPSHPDHGLYLDAQAHVHDLDRQFNRTPDQRSDNLSAALVVAARSDGLHRIDRIELGKDASLLTVVEAPFGAPEKRSEVSVVASMNTTMARSADQWSTAMHDFDRVQEPAPMLAGTQARSPGLAMSPDLGVGPHDPRHPENPNHRLFKELERCVPQASEDRLMQFTVACHASRIDADNLSEVRLDEEKSTIEFIGTGFRTMPAKIDLDSEPPRPEQAIEQIEQHDQRQAQILEEVRAQQAQMSMGRSL
ncbi:XVIPCD domain-containing protein [Luteibacter sp. NPDC031894]|uniref:XVIPCD domain-containing protein n=1 Tax=Luteibacter sp. NPDC031894 TaxID=3390572 RepID=UPI003D04E4C1